MGPTADISEGAFEPIPSLFLKTAAKRASAPAYHVRTDAGWQATSWTEYATQVRSAARALISLGIEAGDTVCILGFNRPEWIIMDQAAMMIGARPAGIYWTSAEPEVAFILNHCQAKILLVENAEQYAKAQGNRPDALQHIVTMEGAQVEGALQWDAFMASGDMGLDAEVDARCAALQPHDIGVQIYTSGTTGNPKAVMLTHMNLWWTTLTLSTIAGVHPDDRLISYLPLAHIAEQGGAILQHAQNGYAIYFARSMDELADHLKEVRPTIFFGVPRVFEKIVMGVREKLSAATGVKAKLANWAMGVGQRWHEVTLAGGTPGMGLTLQKKLAGKLVHTKVKEAMGFDQARLLLCGAAPVTRETLSYLSGLDVLVREVYGQSEDTGPTTINVQGATRLGSVGRPLPGGEVKIAEDGEILVKGPNVFAGYAQDNEATANALDGEWLRSGDLGEFDADGYLYVTGRKKDLIITSGGKNISPAAVEGALMDSPLVAQAVAAGDNRNYLVALLTAEPDALAHWAEAHGMSAEEAHGSDAFHAALQAEVDAVNTRMARVQNIRKFALLPEPLSIDRKELTATLKIRRANVLQNYAHVVEQLYQDA